MLTVFEGRPLILNEAEGKRDSTVADHPFTSDYVDVAHRPLDGAEK